MANKIDFLLGFNLDKNGIQQAKNELDALIDKIKNHPEFGLDKDLQKALKSTEALKKALTKSFNTNFEKLGVKEFNEELRKSGQSLNTVNKNLTNVGVKGARAFNEIQYQIDKVGLSVKESNKFLSEMFDTFGKTVKWGLASSAMNQMTGAVQRALGFTKSLDESLNNIQVVSGKSSLEMKAFANEANEAAKALGKTTTEYTDASLIYFQQGKATEEVKALTEATLLGANVTGTEVSEMADLLTAVMNGYVLEANRALEVTDKLAAVGAATGSDFEELATGMSKVASMANVVGVNIDQLNGMLATVSTVTREAPETIGTTFKTIFARMSELQAGGEDEEGWTTGKVEEALSQIGVSVLDETNQLRDMGEVIEEIGGKWADLNREDRVGTAVAIAGQRQASRLMALFENWSMYSDAVTVSQESLGATMDQNAVRMDSYQYKSAQLSANLEEMWMKIINEDTLKAGVSLLDNLVSGVNTFIDTLGGIGGTLALLGSVAVGVFSRQIGESIDKAKDSLVEFGKEIKTDVVNKVEDFKNRTPGRNLDNEGTEDTTDSQRYRTSQHDEIAALAAGELKIKRNLTAEEHARYKELVNIVALESENLTKAMEKKELADEIRAAGGLTEQSVKTQTEKLKEQAGTLETIRDKSQEIKESAKSTTVSYDELKASLGKQTEYSEKFFESLKKSKKGNVELVDLERAINEELQRQADTYEQIEELRANGLESADQELEAQEAINRANVSQAQGEITEIQSRADREEKLKNMVSYASAAGIALTGLGTAFVQYNKAGASFEDKTNAMTSGLASLGGAALMLPGPWAKLAGGILIASGAAVKWIRENTGMGKILKDNEKALESYKESLAELKEVQDGLAEASTKISEAQALAADGLDPSEQEHYNSLIKEVASLAPQTVAYYDAFGNAVLKSREELDKLNDSLKEQEMLLHATMQGQQSSFGAEIAYLQTEGRRQEAELNEQLQKDNAKLQEALLSQNDKKIKKARENLAETTEALTLLNKQFDEIGTKTQETIIDPFIQGNDVFKDMGAELQGFIGTVFSAENIQREMEAIGRDGTKSIREIESASDEFLTSFKTGVEKVATSFAALNASESESSKNLVKSLSLAKSDVQTSIGSQLTSLSIGLNQEELNKAIDGLATYVNEQGEVDSFGMVKYFQDVAIEAGKALSESISQGIREGLNNADVKKALETETFGGWGESLAKNMADTMEQRAVSYSDEQVYNQVTQQMEKVKIENQAMIDAANALRDGKMEVLASILEENKEVLAVFEEQARYEAEGGFGRGDTYTKGAEALAIMAENTRIAQEEQERLNLALVEQDTIYSSFADNMASSIDGQIEMAELWNDMVSATQEVGEGGLFSVDIEEMQESVAVLQENADAMVALDGHTHATGEALRELSEANADVTKSAKNIGSAFDKMASSLGEDKFAKLADMAGLSIDRIKDLAQAAKDGNIDAARSLQQEMGSIYGAMNRNNAEYFTNFKKTNEARIGVIAEVTGINANQYDTLAEYQDRLEQWKSQKVGEYSRWQVNTINDALTEQVTNMGDAAETTMQYQGRALDATGRAGAISVLEVAKNAAIAAEQAGEGGGKAAANMIRAMGAVDEASGKALETVAQRIEMKGDDFKSVIDYINRQIAVLADGNSGSSDDLKLDGIKVPTFNDFNFKPPSGGISKPSYTAPPTSLSPDNGSVNNNAGDGGSGGSGGSSGGKDGSGADEKEVEDLEWEEDIYHDINIQLQQKSQLLDELRGQQDKLYGKELLDNLAKQKKALEEQQVLLEQKLKMQEQDLANQKKALASQGVTFNVDGTIANYNKLLNQKLAYVNSLSGEAKEAAKEEFSSLVEMMEAYEDMMMNSIEATRNEIQDSIDAQREIFLQEFEYAIQLKIEISDDLKEALDFAKEMNDEFEDMSDNYERTKDQISEQIDLIERIKIKLDEINNNPDLTEKERLELLEKYNAELKEAIKDLKDLEKQLTTIFKDTLKDGLDMVKEHIEDFKHLNDQLKHYEQTLKLIGEGDNFAVLDDIYEAQYGNLIGQIEALNAQMETLQEQKKALEAAGLEGTEEWKAIDDAIKNTQKSLNSLAQESFKLLQTEFKNSVSEIMATLEDAMTQGAGFDKLKQQQKDIQEERKNYLDGEEKLLAISKLQQKVQKEMDETSDPAKQAQLQKFMDAELQKLKDKDKLTKYDVDRANQIYDLTLKQMALEDQRATKNIMRLVRDTQGNWVYEFTEDADAIAKAQEDVSSSLEKLMELDKKKLEETQDLMLKLQEEYYKEVDKISKDAANGKYKTEEEFRQALQEATDRYNQKMVVANDTYEEVKRNATISSMGVLVDTYEKTGLTLKGMTDEQKKVLGALSESTKGDYLELANKMNGLLSKDPESVENTLKSLGLTTKTEMENAKIAVDGMISGMQGTWNLGLSDMISQFIGEGGLENSSKTAIDSIMSKWEEYKTKMSEVQTQTGTSLGTIKDKIEDVTTETDDLKTKTEEITEKFADEITQLTELTTAYAGNREEIKNNISALTDYIAKIDEAIAAIKRKNDTESESNKKPSTDSDSSGSGSGSTSTPKPSTTPTPTPAAAPTKGSKVRVKSDRTWYYDSEGKAPTGKTNNYANKDLYVVNTSKNKYQYAVGSTSNINSALGWLKKEDLVGFDTGGYTGEWGNSGKVAMLHEKEIVLNREDTSKILDAVKLVRGLSGNAIDGIASVIADTSRKTIEALGTIVQAISPNNTPIQQSQIQQTVEINADFSGVKNSSEIEKAFENMANMASQYVSRR